ncbi:Hypothetical_protein [Hexamita inflata]|uniref:Hypothetical_protein n=1 Tax=Hexamita inflata TaxID=28002 RepID=A0AA86VN86_9EUKA|nr:Hypothetical protein HINF_LOCUS58893 [Hexamita inflata]
MISVLDLQLSMFYQQSSIYCTYSYDKLNANINNQKYNITVSQHIPQYCTFSQTAVFGQIQQDISKIQLIGSMQLWTPERYIRVSGNQHNFGCISSFISNRSVNIKDVQVELRLSVASNIVDSNIGMLLGLVDLSTINIQRVYAQITQSVTASRCFGFLAKLQFSKVKLSELTSVLDISVQNSVLVGCLIGLQDQTSLEILDITFKVQFTVLNSNQYGAFIGQLLGPDVFITQMSFTSVSIIKNVSNFGVVHGQMRKPGPEKAKNEFKFVFDGGDKNGFVEKVNGWANVFWKNH